MAHEQRAKRQHSMPITEEDTMRQAQDIWKSDVGKKDHPCLKMMISKPILVIVWVCSSHCEECSEQQISYCWWYF